MNSINIKNELNAWLVDYITNAIHGFKGEDFEEFNKWAKSFKKEEAEFVVNMEFANDWGYDKRSEVPEDEAAEYADSLIKRILDNWYV